MEHRVNHNKKGWLSRKKKHLPTSGEIVYTARNGSIQTIPSLQKHLKSVTDAVIGLQYVWEYRSPSKSVPPHYQCKLCKVQRLQKEMLSHITGWKHCFRYMKQFHKDKVPYEEEEAVKDPVIRKAIKAAAAEVKQAEGRGQIKVVVKEPCDVPGFETMKSAQPNPGNPGIFGPAPQELRGPNPDSMFMGHGGRANVPMRRGPPDMGDFPSPGHYGNSMVGPDRGMMERDSMQHYPDDMQQYPDDMQPYPDDMHMGTDDYGYGRHSEGLDGPFPDDMPMGSSGNRMMGPSDGSSIPATLLRYLDDFRIESEDDAQIVLKVTQKLTDVLMEYRLRSISSVSKPMPSDFSSPHPSYSSNDRFSSGMPGSSRFYN